MAEPNERLRDVLLWEMARNRRSYLPRAVQLFREMRVLCAANPDFLDNLLAQAQRDGCITFAAVDGISGSYDGEGS